MRRARMRVVAALVVLVAAAPPALAEPAGGDAAAGHDDAAGRSHGPAKDAAPPNRTPPEHEPHGATGTRSGMPTDANQGASHAAGDRAAPRSPAGKKDGAADAPAIDARPFPGPRITTGPIKPLLPKPFQASKPHVRHPPAFMVAVPARNAIGIPLDHAPIAKPTAVTPAMPGPNVPAKSASQGPAGGTAVLHPSIAPIATVPRNAGLNGTTIGRIGTGPATVGGAARFTTGINGTSFRPKHGN